MTAKNHSSDTTAISRTDSSAENQAGESRHTPVPWQANGNGIHKGSYCVAIAYDPMGSSHETAVANAEFIVLACNSHDDLLAACKAMLGIDNPPAGEPGHIDFDKAVAMANAAIQRARGKQL